MSLTSVMAKLNLAILYASLAKHSQRDFLIFSYICTNRLQLVLRHNESYTVSINSNNSSNCTIVTVQ